MNPEHIPLRAPSLIWRDMDDGTVLVSPEGGQVRVLNEVGSLVWQIMDGHKSIAAISHQIAQEYAITDEQAARDVEKFLSELDQRELLLWSESDKEIEGNDAR